jgi:hypothetical protein
MARITGEVDPGQIPDEQYRSDLDLRVAAVRPDLCPGVCAEPKAEIA